jgi:hypothetical protein
MEEVKFAYDSLLEGARFELSVPLELRPLVGFEGRPDIEACQAASSALHSASLVQPARIRQLASSADISTMRSSPMVMRRPEKAC